MHFALHHRVGGHYRIPSGSELRGRVATLHCKFGVAVAAHPTVLEGVGTAHQVAGLDVCQWEGCGGVGIIADDGATLQRLDDGRFIGADGLLQCGGEGTSGGTEFEGSVVCPEFNAASGELVEEFGDVHRVPSSRSASAREESAWSPPWGRVPTTTPAPARSEEPGELG